MPRRSLAAAITLVLLAGVVNVTTVMSAGASALNGQHPSYQRYPIGTAGGGPVSLDLHRHRVYTITMADKVAVLDTTTKRVLEVPVGDQPDAIATVHSSGDTYVANSGDGTVSVLDGLKVVKTIHLGANSQPAALAVDQMTGSVYVAETGSDAVAMLAGRALNSTIPVGTAPVAVAASGNNWIYIADNGSDRRSWRLSRRQRPTTARSRVERPTSASGGHTGHVTDEKDGESAPPDWAPPPAPYGAPPGWQPPPPPYAAPPGWTPPPPPYGMPVGTHQPPPYGAPPGWTPPQYGIAAQYGNVPPYGAPVGYPGYGYPRPGNINGFAIASLACALVLGVVPFLGGILGVVFGVIGLRSCARTGERGRGLAIAGIVVGGLAIVFWILVVIGLALGSSTSSGSSGFGAILH